MWLLHLNSHTNIPCVCKVSVSRFQVFKSSTPLGSSVVLEVMPNTSKAMLVLTTWEILLGEQKTVFLHVLQLHFHGRNYIIRQGDSECVSKTDVVAHNPNTPEVEAEWLGIWHCLQCIMIYSLFWAIQLALKQWEQDRGGEKKKVTISRRYKWHHIFSENSTN